MDPKDLYGHSMIQPIPFDEVEMWHGHLDLYMNKLQEIINTPDESDIGYLIEVDLKHPDNIKGKTKNFPFAPEKKIIHKDEYKDNEYMKQKNLRKIQYLKNYYVNR